MASSSLLFLLSLALLLLPSSSSSSSYNTTPPYREYIGAMSTGVKFTDVPIHPNIDFHFILAFGIDYTTSYPPTPTNGYFNAFWDTDNLSSAVATIKHTHPNVRVALSLGGDTVLGQNAYFNPTTIDSWVNNSITSLTSIIRQYNLDGIDIDYEHFRANPRTFAECIGRLVVALKKDTVVSFVSIAPYADPKVQKHYMALWRRYGQFIDYVNFQFYAYGNSTTVPQFLSYFEEQRCNYEGGKVLVSFTSDLGGGLSPKNGFFRACRHLKMEGKLHGIFAWSADTSMKDGFRYEKLSQSLLVYDH